MYRFGTNGEGYADATASIAIGRVSRKERNIDMAKKRSCRRTMNENVIHEKAVKMRRMTDEQLVHYVEDRTEKARSEGYNQGKAQTSKRRPANMEEIISDIGGVRGIGETKLAHIREILTKHLEEAGVKQDA